MKQIEKIILVSMYISQIQGKKMFEITQKDDDILTKDIINSEIDELIKKQLVNKDRKTITETGRNSLSVVLAGGVFDIIHPGHIHTLNTAKKLGDVLVVVVATDTTALKMKKRRPLHSQKQRQQLVNALSVVDCCLVGQEDNIFKTVNHVRPQIIALGYDQVHQEKFIIEGCKKIQLCAKVARLRSPIPENSSSEIQKKYGEFIHGI